MEASVGEAVVVGISEVVIMVVGASVDETMVVGLSVNEIVEVGSDVPCVVGLRVVSTVVMVEGVVVATGGVGARVVSSSISKKLTN